MDAFEQKQRNICLGKIKYRSYEEAVQCNCRLISLYRQPMRPYWCCWCNNWHLTKAKEAKL